MGNRERTINPPVFFIAGGLLVAFLAFGTLAPDFASQLFPPLLDWLGCNVGWFYVLAVTGFLALCVYLLFSQYAEMRLGSDDEQPEFSRLTWFSMLFAAGMGIGLVFNGVAEPIMHYISPPVGQGQTLDAAQAALPTTFLHWGVHAWAIYAGPALAIAFFSFRHSMPLTLRSCFFPLLGQRIHQWPGHLVDILAIIATLFGLACSLGLGAMQISAGFSRLVGSPHSSGAQVVIIAVITAAATLSLVSGINRGIRRLSELNVIVAALLMLVVAAVGPSREILTLGVQSIGTYLSELVVRSFSLGALSPAQTEWTTKWTVVYWAWWIAWAPFVGLFVARISRGRTIREFILGSLLVPTGVTVLWFSIFGGTALHLELTQNAGIAAAVRADTSTAIYSLFELLPASRLLSVLAVILVAVFFVTSSDSASFVVDMLASGGHPNPPVWQRVFWASAEGATAAALLHAGRDGTALKALQAGVLSMGLPFAVVMVLICASLVVGLRRERRGLAIIGAAASAAVPAVAPAVEVEPMKTEKILVPIDFSEPSHRALEQAVRLADRTEPPGTVQVLHVSLPPGHYLPLEQWLGDEKHSTEELRRTHEEAAQQQLSAYLRRYPQLEQRVEWFVEVGLPWKVIVAVAKSRGCDVIVMGSSGRSNLPGSTLGSVAQRVISETSLPVLVV